MEKFNDYNRTAAKRQDRFKKGESLPHRFVEKPAMRSILPNLKGKKVLMLGCGTGEESQLLSENGATELMGIDISDESIRLAKKAYPDYQFQIGDINKLDFSKEEFDFVYSSLAVDYTNDPLRVYKEVYRVLKMDGMFQFSVPHPVRWASEVIDIDGVQTRVMGFVESKERPKVYGNYSDYTENEHFFTLSPDDPLRIWVGPPSMHFRLLKESGFTIEEFIETKAIEEVKEVDEYYYERFSRLPQFTIFQAVKK